MCVKGTAGGSWGRLSCSWGLLVVCGVRLWAQAHTAWREKSLPADSDGCLAQSVDHGGGNNYPQATVWPSPLSEGQSGTVTSFQMCLGGRCSSLHQGLWESCCQPVQGHQCFPDSIPKGWRRSSPRAWSTGTHWKMSCSCGDEG